MLTLTDVVERYFKGELVLFKFYGHQPEVPGVIDRSCLSNWYMCDFTVDRVKYNCMEQYMMAQKALMFEESNPEHNRAVYTKIMASSDPAVIKKLGRDVFGFERSVWAAKIPAHMLVGLEAKFTQNPDLKAFLLGCPKDCVFVEASPYDDIWGIKLDASNPKSDNPAFWQGENRLGFLLTAVRDKLLKEAGDSSEE